MPGFSVHEGRNIDKLLGDKPDWLDPELVGFNVIRMSQSFLEAWRKCPSSAVAEQRPTYGEAAAVGIVAHEIVSGRVTADGIFDDVDRKSMDEKLKELTDHGWSPADPAAFQAACYEKAKALTDIYLDRYHQFLPHVETEVSGRVTWDLRELPGEVDFIVFTGTADLIVDDKGDRVGCDFKSGAVMPEPWTVQRYGVQARAYSVMFLFDRMVFEYPIALAKGHWVAEKYNGIVRFPREGNLTTEVREAYSRQLLAECRPVAEALLRSTDPADHAIHPTDWHCGRWCQRFLMRECLGADIEVPWVQAEHEKEPGIHVPTRRKPIPVGIRDAGEQF